MRETGYLGVDVGSISTNLVLINERAEVLSEIYVRGDGSPIASVQEGMARLRRAVGVGVSVAGVGATGSGRGLVGMLIGADVVQNEITAHARAAVRLHPEVRTIFEIGGQDSKVTIVRDGAVADFAMNLVCAAGTGSFLDAQARRLNITTEQMSELSVLSENPTHIAGRCTVFAESDMVHKQQMGHDQKDIVMGLCYSLVRNYLANVCRGKELAPPFLLQGGVSANKGIRRAFEDLLGHEVIVPVHHMVMGALGAALAASGRRAGATRFRGFGIAGRRIVTRTFCCGDCPNECEEIEILDNGSVVGRTGGRCGKWEGTTGPRGQTKAGMAHTPLRPPPQAGAPWGGAKETGHGVTNAKDSLLEMTRPPFVLVDRSGALGESWWYPYTGELTGWMKGVVETLGGRVAANLRVLRLLRKVQKQRIGSPG